MRNMATLAAGMPSIFLLLCLISWSPRSHAEPAQTESAQDTIGVSSTQKPARVVSLSLCLDELLIALAEPQQIAAVSRVAADPRYSRLWQQAQKLRQHSGLAEQIVAVQPDLILAADYEQGKAVQILRQLGYRVVAFPSPQSLAQIPEHVRAVAALLGAEVRAEQLLQTLKADLQVAADHVHDKPVQLAMSLAPNGYTAGSQSLKNELLHLAGYRTVADLLSLPYDSELNLEQIILSNPDRIFLEEQSGNRDALAHRLLQHPALQSAGFAQRSQAFPSQLWLCPGLAAGQAARALAETPR